MIPIYAIHKEITDYYNLNLEYIFQDSGERKVVEKRQLFHYLCKKLNPKLPSGVIGRYGLIKDHATVLYSIRTIENLLDVDPNFRVEVAELLINCKKHKVKNIDTSGFIQLKYELSAAILECKTVIELEVVLRRKNLILV